ncbi:GTPase [Actinoplanes sp. NBRC 14428]|uniref:Dynamin family protein n=1 Tax=Pseudosporangium ferrugineum TaxID=439699 RepID=A0A2T0SJG0_9ACTN|nr:dynamin family protein [Pseudosporangium ferrugineum]PRY33541.1 dynamin family protein [Pseudosporangium ferrugineum]BCJ56510.1 GTPase [Actinoplanes sp. NBRC 14428]
MTLLADVRAVLDRAAAESRDPAVRAAIGAARRRVDEPLRVAIAGKVKAGKSTLLNALVGEGLAPTDAGECTRIVTWYADGPTYAVTAHLRDGGAEPRPFDRAGGAVRISLGRPAEQVDHLEVRVPSARLRQHTLIDTPGIASLSTDVSLRTMAFLEAEGERATQTDAVLYLLRHMHASDVRFLESFHGDGLAGGSPVNAVGVLSRADEIGGARLDAMEAAARVAARYAADERLRRLCPVVVPVAGLLGAAGATLREDEFRTLAAVATEPMDAIVELLLTADRFADSAPARRAVLERFGLFGVRLGVRLIREQKVLDSADLARALTAHSGIERLREVFAAQFAGRSEVLKARSALAVLDEYLDPESAAAAEVERIRASAHEFVELRLLHLVRSGRLPGRPGQLAEMDRLLGGDGAAAHQRLGLPAGVAPEAIGAAARSALARWQAVAEHPLSARELRTAARAVARSCEAILVQDQQG